MNAMTNGDLVSGVATPARLRTFVFAVFAGAILLALVQFSNLKFVVTALSLAFSVKNF